MTEYCNPIKCEAYAKGWCEYDPINDRLYPVDPDNCPALMEEEKQGGM